MDATPSRWRHSPRFAAAALLFTLCAAALLLWVRPPVPGSWYPSCPTRTLLGLHCPGCGTTRACGALAHGDVAGAWRFNPALVLVGLPLLGWLVVSAIAALVTGRWLRAPIALPPRAGWWIAALLIAYMVLRNVPVQSLDWMRPPDHALPA